MWLLATVLDVAVTGGRKLLNQFSNEYYRFKTWLTGNKRYICISDYFRG